MRKIGRALIALVVLAALGWSAWWAVLAAGQQAAIERWFADRRAAGWQAEHGAVSVGGYPLRLARRIPEVALADPEAGWAWRLPEVALEGEATEPTEFTLTLPEAHVLAVPGERVEITHSRLDAQLGLVPGMGLALAGAALEGRTLRLAAQSGWTAGAKQVTARLSARDAASGPENSYNLKLIARTVEIPAPVLAELDLTGLLEAEIEELRIEAYGAFRQPLDRFALEEGRVDLTRAVLREARFAWGAMAVEARGEFRADRRGYAAGKLRLRLTEWRQMIDLVRQSGKLPRDMEQAITRALELLVLFSGGGESLDVPLELSGGKVRIGPVAVADAPRIARPLQ
ncbi:MAG: DUF2125 domain-containing protein [Pseudomonadota bacterium]